MSSISTSVTPRPQTLGRCHCRKWANGVYMFIPMCVYIYIYISREREIHICIYIYIYIWATQRTRGTWPSSPTSSATRAPTSTPRPRGPGVRDIRDTVCPLFESDSLFLERLSCVVFSSLAIRYSTRGMSKQCPLRVFSEPPRRRQGVSRRGENPRSGSAMCAIS